MNPKCIAIAIPSSPLTTHLLLRSQASARDRAAAESALASARRDAAERERQVEALAALSLRGDATLQECMSRLKVELTPFLTRHGFIRDTRF